MILEQAANVISAILILAGAFFYVVGGIGLVRMPDVFTRLHGASVLDTVGGSLMLVGMMVAGGFSLVTIKLVIILVVILFTSPVATHALAQAAIHAGIEPQLASPNILGDAPPKHRVPKAKQARPTAPRKQAAQAKTAKSKPGNTKSGTTKSAGASRARTKPAASRAGGGKGRGRSSKS